ncbi:hypothetical protein LCGC14_1153310 [marine sediment metagenome]|uniref:Uncharacterized protein n=1 Tax=marine sediment metagenome TaxID=412755 RepID=A0A0F9LZQ2_9ZZZZ
MCIDPNLYMEMYFSSVLFFGFGDLVSGSIWVGIVFQQCSPRSRYERLCMGFQPGHAKTPGSGRPKNSSDKFSVCELKKAFKRAKKNNKIEPGVSIYDWLALQCYKDNTLAVALLKKIMPDVKQIEVIKKYEGGYADMTPAEAAAQMDAATTGDIPDGG